MGVYKVNPTLRNIEESLRYQMAHRPTYKSDGSIDTMRRWCIRKRSSDKSHVLLIREADWIDEIVYPIQLSDPNVLTFIREMLDKHGFVPLD